MNDDKQELIAEHIQAEHDARMEEWIEFNKPELTKEYLGLMKDDFKEYCKAAYWQDVDK